jgi:hypothetical protein
MKPNQQANMNESRELDIGSLQKRVITAVERVDFVGDRMSYIILRGHWYEIIVLNVHAQTRDITEDINDNF